MNRSYKADYGIVDKPDTEVTEAEIDERDSTDEVTKRRGRTIPMCIFAPEKGKPFAKSYTHLTTVEWYDDKTINATFSGGFVVIAGDKLDDVFLALAEHRAHTVKALGRGIKSIKWEKLEPVVRGKP